MKISLHSFLKDSAKASATICAYIARGSNLIDFCAKHDFQFNEIEEFITGQPERAESFRQAIEKRKFYHIESMVKQLAAIIEVDISAAYDQVSGDPLPVNQWPEGLRQSLCVLSKDNRFLGKEFHSKITFKTWDKMKAMELMGKYLDMFNETKTLDVNINIATELQKARDRVVQANKHALIGREGTTAFAKEPRYVYGAPGTPSPKNIKLLPEKVPSE